MMELYPPEVQALAEEIRRELGVSMEASLDMARVSLGYWEDSIVQVDDEGKDDPVSSPMHTGVEH